MSLCNFFKSGLIAGRRHSFHELQLFSQPVYSWVLTTMDNRPRNNSLSLCPVRLKFQPPPAETGS